MLIFIFFSFDSQSQVYLLNEDFSTAADTVPPGLWSGYNQTAIPGKLKWRFDNSGNLPLGFPLSGRVAVLDPRFAGLGFPQRVSLESPFIDCSVSPNILLFFHNQFDKGNSGIGKLEVFSEGTWNTQAQYQNSTGNSVLEIINVSQLAGSRDSVKFRFTWEGDSSGYWAVDNFKILVPSPRDLNLLGLSSPVMPFQEGVQPVKINLFNEGIETITSARINWEVNGIPQPTFNWTGNLSFGERSSDIEIGTFLFNPGEIQTFRIWAVNPNNATDYNLLNDTVKVRLGASMCGNYTIGGSNPDFQNFNEAAFALNNASISCPVIFKVRPGLYQEQLSLSGIAGSNNVNTVTFEPENGDSTSVTLRFSNPNSSRDFTLSLNGSQNIRFNKINVTRTNGELAVLFVNKVGNVTFERCQTGNIGSLDGSADSSIVIKNCRTGYIRISGFSGVGNVKIINNKISVSSSTGGVFSGVFLDKCVQPEVKFNVISVTSNQDVTGLNCEAYGIQLIDCPSARIQFNNFTCRSQSHFASRTNKSTGLNLFSSPNATVSRNSFSVFSNVGKAITTALLTDSSSHAAKIDSNNFILSGLGTSGFSTASVYGLNIRSAQSSIMANSIQLHPNSYPMNFGIFSENDSNFIARNNISGAFNGIIISGKNTVLTKNKIYSIFDKGIHILSGNGNQVLKNEVFGVKGFGCKISGSNSTIANNFFQVEGSGTSIGINLDSGSVNNDVIFNSVNACGTDQFNNTALSIGPNSNSRILNNIFCNSGLGSSISASNPGTGLLMDNNCYHARSGILLNFNSASVSSLSGLIQRLGGNVGSVSVNPFFTSITSPEANHIGLNGKAVPVSGLETDISDAIRSLPPDIGAKEFTPCNFDAGIDRFTGLQTPVTTGIRPIKIVVRNNGSAPLTNFSIQWFVNGIAQNPVQLTGQSVSDTLEVVLGTYNFLAGAQTRISAFLQLSNDCNPSNDTIRSGSIISALCGTYRIGGTGSDFNNFQEAVSILSQAGISCPVVFKVANGIYSEQIEINKITGSSIVNTVTFESVSGDSSKVILEYSGISSDKDYTLNLRGTDNLRIRKLGISRKNGNVALLMSDGNHHLQIHSSITGNIFSTGNQVDSFITVSSNATGFIQLNNKSGFQSKEIRIMNNSVNSEISNYAAHNGIQVVNSVSPLIQSNKIRLITKSAISGTSCSPQISCGISLTGCQSAQVSGNFSQSQSTYLYGICQHQASGIILDNSPNSIIKKNYFFAESYNARSTSSGAILTGNNYGFVLDSNNFLLFSANPTIAQGTRTVNGIRINSSGRGIVSNNSISLLQGSDYGNTGIFSAADSSQIINNAITLFRTGIETRGNSSHIFSNRINQILGTGLFLKSGTNQRVFNNRIINVSGSGVEIESVNSTVYNNLIQTIGNLPSRGIYLKSAATNAGIYFNSVNSLCNDVQVSTAIDVVSGTGSKIKNNIFCNYGSGPSMMVDNPGSGRDWDYNCYFSRNSALLVFGNQLVTGLSQLQAALGQNAFSLSVNPFFSGDTNFMPFQSILDKRGISIPSIGLDFSGQTRGAVPDIGAREFEPCPSDLGINEISGLPNPLTAGLQPINIVLQNHGTSKAQSATIFWEVNSIPQPSFFWTGNLDGKTSSTVQIGNYYFLPGRAYVIRTWVKSTGVSGDCNIQNDSAFSRNLVTFLCGTFTVGGNNPDFVSLTDAVSSLNSTGISCPVVFKLRDGVYKEQIEIGRILGSSPLNTITVESESGDSSRVLIQYEIEDSQRDFSVGIRSASNLIFRNIGVGRLNGSNSIQLSDNSTRLTFNSCSLGKVFSPGTSSDSLILFQNNSISSIVLQSPSSSRSKGIRITNNIIRANTSFGTSGSAISISGSDGLLVSGNQISSRFFQSVVGTSITSNGVILANCSNGKVTGNRIISESRSRFVNTENIAAGIQLFQSAKMEISDNKLLVKSSVGNPRSLGIVLDNGCSFNMVRNNIIEISSLTPSSIPANQNRGISISGGSQNVCKGNSIVPIDSAGSSGFILYGIFSAGSQSTISDNVIYRCNFGIESRGQLTEISANRVLDVSGISVNILTGSSQSVSANRIFRNSLGYGIAVAAPECLIANNVIQTIGLGLSKGMLVSNGSTRTRIIFNSIRNEGTDPDLSAAIEFQGSSGTVMKNNIFANLYSGNAIQVGTLPSSKDWDFNCYYTAGIHSAKLGNFNIQNFSDWSQLISAEVNSKFLQPFFQSDTLLIPGQRQINGAGIPVPGITTDISGSYRSSLAPDMGAYEFVRDYGFSKLLSPTLACLKSDTEKVAVRLVCRGNVPLNVARLAYTINNGPLKIDTLEGPLSSDLDFVFKERADLSPEGSYLIKVWLVDNLDDNPSNDTLSVIRFSKLSPQVNISYSAGCTNEKVDFNVSVSVPSGVVLPVYEWFFGDTDTSIFAGSPVSHFYSRSDTFLVKARAFTSVGCFGEGQKELILQPTPVAAFNSSDHCFGSALPLENLSDLEGDSLVSIWNFGDGTESSLRNPSKIFSSLGEFQVTLIVRALGSQCADTISELVKVNPLPALTTNIDTAYFENQGFIPLIGTPPGGIFFGNGVFGNLFNTDFVGVGNTTISYSYQITGTGCSDTVSQNVKVKEVNQPPQVVFSSPAKVVCSGKAVSLLVQATGTRLRFQWYRNSQLLPNDTLPILNFNPALESNSGNYQLRIWNVLDTIESGIISLKVEPLYSRTDSVVICPNAVYQLPGGQTVSSPGIYVSAFLSRAGCDSTITTVLDTSRLIRRNFAAVICNGSNYNFYGQILNQSGIYSKTILNGTGCDSLYVLNLNVLIPDTIQQSLASCQPLVWYGQTISASGTYYTSVPSGTGLCDSTFRLNFSLISPPDTSITELSNCGPLLWNSSLISGSGTYYFNTTTSLGCDSVARLDAVIFNVPDTSVTNASSCGPYIWNNLAYLVSGTYYRSFPLPNGCDSIARLNVIISPIEDTSFVSVTSCGAYTWNNQLIQNSGTYYFDTLTAGGCDSVARLEIVVFPKPDTLFLQQESCGAYVWNGNLLTSSGIYFYQGKNANGCDSVAVLSLQVFPAPDTSVTTVQNCGSYNWNGTLYSSSGIYFKNFSGPGQCDSVARLNLTIYSIESRDTVRSCGPYFWSGQSLDSSGLYQFISLNALGCDSTSFLQLVVLPVPDTSDTEVQSCGPYFWNGETLFFTGTFYHNTLNSNGCDSVARLNLVVVNPPKDSILVDSSCGSYVWNDVLYSQSGTYLKITPLPNGCDSTSILVLTIIPTSSNEIQTSCGPYIWKGDTLTSSGTYTKNFVNILGCDSVVTLDLTLYNLPDSSFSVVNNCGPYFWNGSFRNSSGLYYYITQNPNGCDSTAVLNLTLLPQPDTVHVVDSACGSYTWKGQLITESGTYLFITPGPAGGCDTVSRLQITIFPNSSSEFVTACSEYVWNNQAYSETGVYTFITTSSKGCDSTATLNLTIISPPEPVYLEFTRCLPFQWNSQTFDSAGVYQINIDLPGICDSVYFLTIVKAVPPDSSFSTVSHCGPYFWNGAVRDSSGIYFYSVVNSSGCDSTAQLNLTVLPSVDIVTNPVSIGFTEGNSITLSVVTIPPAGSDLSLQWQVNQGSGFVNIPASDASYQGTDSVTLVILNAPLSFDGYQYRCIVSNGSCSDTSGTGVITRGETYLQSEPSIFVQPNPAREKTFVRTGKLLLGSTFRLFDLRGVELLSGTLNESLTELDLRSLPSGMYSLKVESAQKGFLRVCKILVE